MSFYGFLCAKSYRRGGEPVIFRKPGTEKGREKPRFALFWVIICYFGTKKGWNF
jgi:hypothetical protein